MLGIVLQNLSCGNSLKNLVKGDILFNHLLMSVLGNANVLCFGLDTYLLQYSLQIEGLGFIDPFGFHIYFLLGHIS